MIIDAHQHFWHYDPVHYAWITDAMAALKRDFLPSDLEPELARNNVGGCVLVQVEQSERETEFLLQLADRSEKIAGVVGWIDLASPTIVENLQRYERFKKLRGFRHIVQDEPDDRFLLREEVVRGVQALSAFDYTYDILIYPKQLPAALELVSRLPKQRFVIDHLAKPIIRQNILEPWASQIRAIAKYPNVYCKVSGLVTEANWRGWTEKDFRPYLDVVWGVFGAKRLMFGSDWPVCLLAGNYAEVKQLIESYVRNFSSHEREQIFGGTAAHFYGLENGLP
jgi:L-fuconolactonase